MSELKPQDMSRICARGGTVRIEAANPNDTSLRLCRSDRTSVVARIEAMSDCPDHPVWAVRCLGSVSEVYYVKGSWRINLRGYGDTEVVIVDNSKES